MHDAELRHLVCVPVELATSALCGFIHRWETAVLADPAQHQPGHIECKGRWGIETALLLGLDGVTECRRQVARRPSQQVLVNDDHAEPGNPEVFLRTGIDQPESLDRNRTGEKVRGHVGDQRYGQLWKVPQLKSVSGFVAGDMAITRVRRRAPLLERGQGSEGLSCSAGYNVHPSVSTSLTDRPACPVPTFQVVGALPWMQHVERQQPELGTGSALQEQHAIAPGDRQQRTQVCFDFFHQPLEGCAGEGLFQYRRTGAAPVRHLFADLRQHLGRQHRRASGEVIALGELSTGADHGRRSPSETARGWTGWYCCATRER